MSRWSGWSKRSKDCDGGVEERISLAVLGVFAQEGFEVEPEQFYVDIIKPVIAYYRGSLEPT